MTLERRNNKYVALGLEVFGKSLNILCMELGIGFFRVGILFNILLL
jgi:hypothetical protein